MTPSDKLRIEELERQLVKLWARVNELEARPWPMPYYVPQPYPGYPMSPTIDPWPCYSPTITCEVTP